ncbi:MAG: P-II family nitrogen regulator [Xenococcaceae cyanobacterium MO_167.B52]|nr:P-II family nitrogen regulator [Xenococcaceae cyanobacterium MO_167.B52]
MKKVAAIIHAHKLDDVKLALISNGVIGMTVSDIKSFGTSRKEVTRYRGTEYKVDFISKLKIEVVVEDSLTDYVVQEISLSARTGTIGDGKIFVFPVDQIIRIRTKETGIDAI